MYSSLKSLLENENIIISVAISNINELENKILNENEENVPEKGRYNSASVNSDINNKITITGYNVTNNNTFLDNNDSCLPV